MSVRRYESIAIGSRGIGFEGKVAGRAGSGRRNKVGERGRVAACRERLGSDGWLAREQALLGCGGTLGSA